MIGYRGIRLEPHFVIQVVVRARIEAGQGVRDLSY